MPQTHVPLRRRQKQGTAQIPAIILDADQDTGIFSPADDTVSLAIGGDEAVRFDPAGRMGIGTPSPQELLHVNGVIATNSYLAIGRGDASHVRLVNSSGTLHLRNQANSADAHLIVGNLTVTGDFTTTTSNTVELGDEFIVLNNDYTGGSPFADAGIKVERGTETNASLLWDESSDRWKAGFLGSEATIWTSATDGAGSGLDADLLDGQQGSYYRAWANLTGVPNLAVRDSNQTISGTWTFQAKPRLDGNGLLLQSEGGAPGGTLGYITLHGESSGLWATIGTGSAFRMLTTDDSSSFATSSHSHALADLSNVSGTPTDGYALVWNNTGGYWEPGQISTVTSLAQLTDTTLTSPANGEYLKYNGSEWVNAALSVSLALTDLTNVTAGSPTDGYALVWSDTNSRWEPGQVSGVTSLTALTDTTLSSPANGEVLKYNGSAWVNGTFTLSDLAAGGTFSFGDGTVTAPSITNDGDTNTGFYFPAANELAVTTDGTKRSLWDDTGNFFTTGQTSEIARTAQDGFMYVGTMEQAPLSAPNNLPAGTAPMVIDRGTHSIYAYYDGAWHAVGRGVGAPGTYGLTYYNEGDYVS